MKVLIMMLFVVSAFSQTKGKEKVVYKYKKFQEFDLETLGVGGELGAPQDLSLNSRFLKKFKNKLPVRKNFNQEIRRSVEVIR